LHRQGGRNTKKRVNSALARFLAQKSGREMPFQSLPGKMNLAKRHTTWTPEATRSYWEGANLRNGSSDGLKGECTVREGVGEKITATLSIQNSLGQGQRARKHRNAGRPAGRKNVTKKKAS